MKSTTFAITDAIRVIRVKSVCAVYDLASLNVAERITINNTHDLNEEETGMLFDYIVAATIHLYAIEQAKKETPFEYPDY